MKHILSSTLVILLLAGCSSFTTPLSQQAKVKEFAGGDADGGKTALFWLTERSDTPLSSSDDVKFTDNSWYKSHYVWSGKNLRELTRVGERPINSGKLVPYQVTLRFSSVGEAVYQRQDINGKVMPMRSEQIHEMKTQADELITTSKSQQKQGLQLIQGYWNYGAFTTCAGEEYTNIEFTPSLPEAVVNSLNNEQHFAAFIGEYRVRKIVVDELVLLKEGDFNCVERPQVQS